VTCDPSNVTTGTVTETVEVVSPSVLAKIEGRNLLPIDKDPPVPLPDGSSDKVIVLLTSLPLI